MSENRFRKLRSGCKDQLLRKLCRSLCNFDNGQSLGVMVGGVWRVDSLVGGTSFVFGRLPLGCAPWRGLCSYSTASNVEGGVTWQRLSHFFVPRTRAHVGGCSLLVFPETVSDGG